MTTPEIIVQAHRVLGWISKWLSESGFVILEGLGTLKSFGTSGKFDLWHCDFIFIANFRTLCWDREDGFRWLAIIAVGGWWPGDPQQVWELCNFRQFWLTDVWPGCFLQLPSGQQVRKAYISFVQNMTWSRMRDVINLSVVLIKKSLHNASYCETILAFFINFEGFEMSRKWSHLVEELHVDVFKDESKVATAIKSDRHRSRFMAGKQRKYQIVVVESYLMVHSSNIMAKNNTFFTVLLVSKLSEICFIQSAAGLLTFALFK